MLPVVAFLATADAEVSRMFYGGGGNDTLFGGPGDGDICFHSGSAGKISCEL